MHFNQKKCHEMTEVPDMMRCTLNYNNYGLQTGLPRKPYPALTVRSPQNNTADLWQ